MLEHRVLLVRPGSVSGVRAIVDGDSGKPLGFARWDMETPRCWWRAFARPALAIHEHEDEPLLCTVRRAWGVLPRSVVRDADGQPVGSCSFTGRLIRDRYGRNLAAFHDADGTLRSPTQRVLAELMTTEDGLRIAFDDVVAGEPFVKMLLLSACLVGRASFRA